MNTLWTIQEIFIQNVNISHSRKEELQNLVLYKFYQNYSLKTFYGERKIREVLVDIS